MSHIEYIFMKLYYYPTARAADEINNPYFLMGLEMVLALCIAHDSIVIVVITMCNLKLVQYIAHN